MSGPIVVSIDSSTTACKAIAWDEHGVPLSESRAAYPTYRPHKGWAEQQAEDWWTCACAALNECLDRVDSGQVDALCMTHQRETFVVVDKECQPLRNAILWLDERSSSQLEWLDRTFGADMLHDLTGKPPSMTQSLPKIVWLIQNEPDLITRADKLLDVHAFLAWRLTDEQRTSLASADPLALIDMRAGEWATDLISDLGLRRDQFVEVVAPGEVIGEVTPAAAAATGLPHGLPVIAGVGDGQSAGLGANTVDKGRAYLNLGTGIASGVITEQYMANRAYRTLNAPIPGHFFLEHILRGGTFTVSWFVEKFAADLAANPSHSPEQRLEQKAARVPPGCQGLMVVPYWNSVMNPYWDPSATGITIGWTGDHGREHFYRAILEGIAYEQRLVGDAIGSATGEPIVEYVVLGGGSRSDLWCQIMADVTGVPVVRSTTTEATCLGAAILAAAASDWYPNVRTAADAMTGLGRRFVPDTAVQSMYNDLYESVYLPLYPTLQPLLRRLHSLSSMDNAV